MAYFEKPDIDLENKRIVAVFTAYNEEERIPFFLSYYRRMGVDHFLAIDNNSADNSKALLTAQPDVTYFHTAESYVASAAGRLWTSELAEHYCVGHWCLTLDLDEQLVFPGCESATLVDLCDYLDEHSYEGIFTVFLDMYSAGPLSDAVYTPGQPFLEVCDHFDVASYALRQPMYFPQVAVFGGPRQRIFWEEGKAGNGPSMRKMPLVRWRSGFKYLYSTHSSSPIRLADITGALLHFKFFSSFSSFAERELARGDRVQTADYENYVRLTKEQNVVFKNDASVKYESSVTLVDHGVAVCTRPYLNWLRPRLNQRLGSGPARRYDNELRGATRAAWDRASLKLSQLPVIWGLIGSRIEGGVIGILERTVVGWFIDRGGNERSEEIVARVDGEIVARGRLGHVLSEQAMVEEEHRDATFALTIPVMVFEERANVRVTLGGVGDAVPFASFVMHRLPKVSESDEYQGECYLTQDRRIAGWAWRPKDPGRTVSVAVHIDGQFWRRVPANAFREQIRLRGIGDGKHGFSIPMPEWVEPGQSCVVHVTIHATNLQLRGSPIEIGKKKETPATGGDAPKPAETEAVAVAEAAADAETPRETEEKLTGKVLTARAGTVIGWLSDLTAPDRLLTLDVKIDGRDRGAVVANAQLPMADTRASPLSGHGFIIPVFRSWLPPPLGRGYRELSLRVRQTGEMLVDQLRVAGPNVPLALSPYRGHLDSNEDGVVRGWVWRPSDPEERVEVAVFIDGFLLKVAAARDLREDLWGHDIGDGRHAFEIPIPERFFDDVEHLIDVVVAREGIALGNGPMISQGDVVRSRRQMRSALPGLSQLVARFGH